MSVKGIWTLHSFADFAKLGIKDSILSRICPQLKITWNRITTKMTWTMKMTSWITLESPRICHASNAIYADWCVMPKKSRIWNYISTLSILGPSFLKIIWISCVGFVWSRDKTTPWKNSKIICMTNIRMKWSRKISQKLYIPKLVLLWFDQNSEEKINVHFNSLCNFILSAMQFWF